MNELLERNETAEHPAALVARCARVVTVFDHRSQDSGNVSWLVSTDDGDLFVKTAGRPGRPRAGAPVPYYGQDDRTRLLRNAVSIAGSCEHRCLARVRNVIETPDGPMLVYDRAAGDSIGTLKDRRRDAGSAYQRFAQLAPERLLGAFDDLTDLHRALAAAGWIAGDLYDGCLIFDFLTDRLTVIDLDSYQPGPGINQMGRMFGSDRFMAPEEFLFGAPIDQRTTVFTLARLAWHFGTRTTERPERFCGSEAVRSVLEQARQTDPCHRYPSVAEFASAWFTARQ